MNDNRDDNIYYNNTSNSIDDNNDSRINESNQYENGRYENERYDHSYDRRNDYIYVERRPKRKGKKLAIFLVVVLLFASVCTALYSYKDRILSALAPQKSQDIPIEETKLDLQQVSKKDTEPNYVSKIVESIMPSIVTVASESYKYDAFENPIAKTVNNGTGFIVKDNGDSFYIATNNHVINGGKDIKVSFIDNTVAAAKVKGADADEDLAVIEVQKSEISSDTLGKLKVAVIGKSSDLNIGDDVIAIGNALGYGQSVTRGIVSAVDRGQNLSQNFLPLIQTDAAINPGNSGGPLVNYEGQVIGINTIKLASDEIEGIGYAIPSDVFVPELNYLASGQTNDNAVTIGITAKIVNEQISQMYGWPQGIYVAEVTSGSAADKAGIKKGDIITKFDGQEVINFKNFQRLLRLHKPGDSVSTTIYRLDGSTIDLNIVLGKKKGE